MTSEPALLTYEDFQPAIGQEFNLRGDPAAAPFILLSVERLPDYGATEALRAPFSLTLRTTSIDPAQGLREFRNAALGDLDIFVTPVARDGDGLLYEAIFN